MNMPTFRQTKSIPETVKKKKREPKNNNKNSGIQAKSLTLKKNN